MKLCKFVATTLATAALACAAEAQQLYGPWVHDASLPFSLYVDPVNGSNSNTGFDPANAYQTLDWAVDRADFWQSVLYPITPGAMTLNLLPGTYTLNQPLRLPAFGLSIEAYWTALPSTVTITGAISNDGLLDFDHLVGPLTQAAIGLPDDMPPSILRGLTITGNTSGYGVEIDPSQNPSADIRGRTIEVQVNQCTISQCARGVEIRNQNGLQLEYRNVIVDNGIGSCSVGVEVLGRWYESDLFRSNRIIGSMTAMRFDGSGAKEGMLHPRILSNTIHNASQMVGVALTDCSARIVNNTLANVTAPCCNATTATIGISPDGGGSSGERIVIVNNILFSPTYFDGTVFVSPPEIRVFGATAYSGVLVVDGNDFDSSGALITPALPVGPSNVGIANAQFVASPANLHLTAASPSIVNPGIRAFVVPGATATITLNGQSVPANCALDVDLDARTHMRSSDLTEVLHRGSDQFIETGARLRTATSGANPLALADRFGNVPVDSLGNAQADLLLDLPVGSAFSIVLGAALPMGPELQHLVVSPFGSLAVDPSPGNGTTVLSGVTTVNPQPLNFNLGTVSPAFTEAEMYLQALIALPNGVVTFTNRIRLDVDGI